MQFRLRTLFLAVMIVAGIALGVKNAMQNIEDTQSTFAARLVANMCVSHMEANHQQWPANWEDLRDDFEPCLARSGESWEFDDLENRVEVNWNADPWILTAQQDNPNAEAPQLIWVRSDDEVKFYGTSPEWIILNYLKSQTKPVAIP
ncbi:MAG: hypothetical protein COA78_30630 [Blastopirellula sp.]|nr:MAG: hypothetical protein COA78_30630 [Blastopirellula sp.]